MQRLTYVLFQLDEALRYVDDGRVERLRMALLLLDNAAELQLERRVRDHLTIEEINERTRQQTLLIADVVPHGHEGMPELSKELVAWEPLTRGQKRALNRFFDEKLRFLSERYTTLDPRLAQVLSYLHRYRNEAYHEGRVRAETVRTAALIYFEANCELLLSVFRIGTYSSNEDYSWLEERFGLRGSSWFAGAALPQVVSVLREPVLPTLESVVDVLSDHLESRIADLLTDLEYVVSESRPDDRDEAARVAQLYADLERGGVEDESDLETYVGRWSLETVDGARRSIAGVRRAVDRLGAFARFADIEQQMEKFEADVRPLVTFVERLVDEEIDRRRGK